MDQPGAGHRPVHWDARQQHEPVEAQDRHYDTQRYSRAATPPYQPAWQARNEDDGFAEDDDARHAAAMRTLPPVNPNVGKIKHLKKEDGAPLWRVDIQYEFLFAVFSDTRAVFTNSYQPQKPKQSFAELYIDTMARSSNTSGVLRAKLLADPEAAKGVAMVCLLVNFGRMNTTLNFFPEMRAAGRTYHAIPSLQSHQDPHAYKQIQDAPRLKSILNGATEDRAEPTTLFEVKANPVPRTNPVNLLFIICQEPVRVAELHFPLGGEFADLLLRTTDSSLSRATAFLWIMWFYLESDFTEEGCMENPFGFGMDYNTGVANQGIPRTVSLTPEEEARENVDPPDEVEFGRSKQAMRKKRQNADQEYSKAQTAPKASSKTDTEEPNLPASGILPRIRPSKHESDVESLRSTPPRAPPTEKPQPKPKSAMRTSMRAPPASAPAPSVYLGSSPGGPVQRAETGTRRTRPPTAHQVAIERHRNERVDHILDRGLAKERHQARRSRKRIGAVVLALRRNARMTDPFCDSEEEELAVLKEKPVHAKGESLPTESGGPLGESNDSALNEGKREDWGEAAAVYASSLRRASRRLDRWCNFTNPLAVNMLDRPAKRARYGDSDDENAGYDYNGRARDPNETEEEAEDEENAAAHHADVSTLTTAEFRPRGRAAPQTKASKKRRRGEGNGYRSDSSHASGRRRRPQGGGTAGGASGARYELARMELDQQATEELDLDPAAERARLLDEKRIKRNQQRREDRRKATLKQNEKLRRQAASGSGSGKKGGDEDVGQEEDDGGGKEVGEKGKKKKTGRDEEKEEDEEEEEAGEDGEDKLDDTEKELLGLRSGLEDEDDDEEGDADGDGAGGARDEEMKDGKKQAVEKNGDKEVEDQEEEDQEEEDQDNQEDQEDLDDLERTLLGKMETDSGSE